MNEELTIERLKQVLRYDPETGLFWWRIKTSNRTNLNKPAGSLNNDGYVRIKIDGEAHLAHRLVWFYINEKWPAILIDHINGIRHDNRIENLRDVTNSINQQNQRNSRSNNKSSGLLGVSFNKQAKKYMAHIRIDGKRNYLGLFDNPQEAHAAYLEAKRLNHPGCTI